jgi:hypothetical protein
LRHDIVAAERVARGADFPAQEQVPLSDPKPKAVLTPLQ